MKAGMWVAFALLVSGCARSSHPVDGLLDPVPQKGPAASAAPRSSPSPASTPSPKTTPSPMPTATPTPGPSYPPLTLERFPLVLMYHEIVTAIDPRRQSTSDVTVAAFRKQLEFLKREGYRSINGEELLAALDGREPLPPKSVLITFDDGYLGQYTLAVPVLKELGMKAVFFVNPSTIDSPSWNPHMTWLQARELDQHESFEIQSHTLNHLKLDEVDADTLKSEFGDSHAILQAQLGHTVRLAAYPFGRHSVAVIHMAGRYHSAAFAVGTPAKIRYARYQIPRLSMTTALTQSAFENRVRNFAIDPLKFPLR